MFFTGTQFALCFAACSAPVAVIILRPYISFFRFRQNLAKNDNVNLPCNLTEWRNYPNGPRLWEALRPKIEAYGYVLWRHAYYGTTKAPQDQLSPYQNGYLFANTCRQELDIHTPGSLKRLYMFEHNNALSRPARTRAGQDVRVRVIVVNGDGREHLEILRKLATGPSALISGNHTLPLLQEFQFHNVVFGVFPLVGSTMLESTRAWVKNTVEDVLEMMLQALEGLVFIHKLGIAHRDAFHDNFLVQWQPESQLVSDSFASRPRVYLIDFEVAVQLPLEGSPEQLSCCGLPIGGSFTNIQEYIRPYPSDLRAGKMYNPYKLDVWQLSYGLVAQNFASGDSSIDELLANCHSDDPELRMSSDEALRKLATAMKSVPLSCLQAPVTWNAARVC